MDPEQLRGNVKKGLIIAVFFGLALLFYALRWQTVLVAYLIVVALVSMLAVLIQSGRGGGLASSLGGLGGDSLLGVRSASPVAKATYVLLALFMFIAMLNANLNMRQGEAGGLLQQGAPPERGLPAGEPGAELPAGPAPGGGAPLEPQPGAPAMPAPGAEQTTPPAPEEGE
ncbi:MAG: preprotein translocase subunit SecG [Candidatus Brocadiia bacterium]